MRTPWRPVADPVQDLIWGSSCVGCAEPGAVLCLRCRAALPVRGFDTAPTPAPPGLAPVRALSGYDGVVREMILGHKEHGLLGLGADLGDLLARAAWPWVGGPGAGAAPPLTLLVPAPSRRRAVRARGYDATARIVRSAARRLTGAGGPGEARVQVRAVGLLRFRSGVGDQAGLDAAGRRANLTGSMWVPAQRLRTVGRRLGSDHVRVLVCDDVITTGWTAWEAQRALEAVGLPVSGHLLVATTSRRTRPGVALPLG